jgi:large subunit ribosomal protein L25
MEKITLNVELRDKKGKGPSRALRRAESIPAVIYRTGDSSPLMIDRKEMLHFIQSTSGEQVLVNLMFPDKSTRLALMKEYQTDPVRGELLHADFMEVSMTEKVRVSVHVVTAGEPIGVKRDKGILQHTLREIEIECLPDRIPGHLEMDVSGLLTGQSLHVSDIALPEGVKVLTDPGEVIASVMAPALVEEAVAEEVKEEAAPEEGPEIIKKGKKEEAEEEK